MHFHTGLHKGESAYSLDQCSARAAQDIWEHHRPAVGSSVLVLGSVHSSSEKLEPSTLEWKLAPCLEKNPAQGCSQQPSSTCVRDWSYWEVDISLVIGINQTNHSTNQERPCTTIQRIKKELSICPSQQRPDLVTFPVLSQIKPHTPRLVVPFRQFL